jgi:hypothetical protein
MSRIDELAEEILRQNEIDRVNAGTNETDPQYEDTYRDYQEALKEVRETRDLHADVLTAEYFRPTSTGEVAELTNAVKELADRMDDGGIALSAKASVLDEKWQGPAADAFFGKLATLGDYQTNLTTWAGWAYGTAAEYAQLTRSYKTDVEKLAAETEKALQKATKSPSTGELVAVALEAAKWLIGGAKFLDGGSTLQAAYAAIKVPFSAESPEAVMDQFRGKLDKLRSAYRQVSEESQAKLRSKVQRMSEPPEMLIVGKDTADIHAPSFDYASFVAASAPGDLGAKFDKYGETAIREIANEKRGDSPIRTRLDDEERAGTG